MLIRVTFLLAFLIFSSCSKPKNDKINIGFSQCISHDVWRENMNQSMAIQAGLYSNIDLQIAKADSDIQRQIQQIEDFMEQEVDVLIVSPLESTKIVPVIEKAYDSGIPVILLDRKIDSDKYTSFIGADNLSVGRMAASYIASKTTTKVNVLEVKPAENSSPVVERSLGFHQIADKSTNIKSTVTIDDYTDNKFGQVLDSLDSSQIDYVFAFNDIMARWSWEVANSKGIASTIKFIGVDGFVGVDQGIDMILDGRLNATILYPTGGAEAIKIALKIHKGERVQKINNLDITLIDKLNADIMKNQFLKINEQQEEIQHQIQAITTQKSLYEAQGSLLRILVFFLVIILSLAIYTIYSIFIIRKKNRQLVLTNNKVTIQRNQIKKIADEVKEINEAKFNFFTGLSHEFKTPITLILSALESLQDSFKSKNRKYPYEVNLISKNSNRLLRLINNLLDFRKVEDQKFNLRVSKTNIYKFSLGLYKDFEQEAQKRNIQFTLKSASEKLDLFIDRNLMDKVYFNLLSNAFKFTPDNGKIDITILQPVDEAKIEIRIKDNGIGIPHEELDEVFTPFFKGSNNRKNSSGVGLFLSKQFIDLHLGKVVVKSFQGTEFIITLFKGDKHFNEDQIVAEPELVELFDTEEEDDYILDQDFTVNPSEKEDRYSVLIIEDNRDLSHFLKKKLNIEFEVLTSDGTNAIDLAIEHIPDIILCDVNLPEKDGFEICTILKNELTTSHIPTIILTANSDKESYLKGLESKADLFLTKPFSYSILMQSIKSLLYNREKLRYYFTNNLFKESGTEQIKNPEQQFMVKLTDTIKRSFEDSEFNVEALATELGMSRVQLYRKTKAILGYGIGDHINNFRLIKAKTLLEQTNSNISEIAYACGFSTPSYFSTAFKAKYDLSPNTYRKEHRG